MTYCQILPRHRMSPVFLVDFLSPAAEDEGVAFPHLQTRVWGEVALF